MNVSSALLFLSLAVYGLWCGWEWQRTKRSKEIRPTQHRPWPPVVHRWHDSFPSFPDFGITSLRLGDTFSHRCPSLIPFFLGRRILMMLGTSVTAGRGTRTPSLPHQLPPRHWHDNAWQENKDQRAQTYSWTCELEKKGSHVRLPHWRRPKRICWGQAPRAVRNSDAPEKDWERYRCIVPSLPW